MSPGKLDRISVQRHLDALDESLSQLERHAGRPLEELQDNLDERWIVERGLQLSVQKRRWVVASRRNSTPAPYGKEAASKAAFAHDGHAARAGYADA